MNSFEIVVPDDAEERIAELAHLTDGEVDCILRAGVSDSVRRALSKHQGGEQIYYVSEATRAALADNQVGVNMDKGLVSLKVKRFEDVRLLVAWHRALAEVEPGTVAWGKQLLDSLLGKFFGVRKDSEMNMSERLVDGVIHQMNSHLRGNNFAIDGTRLEILERSGLIVLGTSVGDIHVPTLASVSAFIASRPNLAEEPDKRPMGPAKFASGTIPESVKSRLLDAASQNDAPPHYISLICSLGLGGEGMTARDLQEHTSRGMRVTMVQTRKALAAPNFRKMIEDAGMELIILGEGMAAEYKLELAGESGF
jgi:hypothetical protein